MNRLMDTLKKFNAEWNDLPRRLLLIIVLIGSLLFALLIFPFIAPFVLAALFAWMIEPLVRLATRRFGDRRAIRAIVSALLVLLLAGLVFFLLGSLFGRLLREAVELAKELPGWVNSLSAEVSRWIENLDFDWLANSSGIEEMLTRLFADMASMLTSFATRMASSVARVAWQVAGFLPQGILFVVLTLIGTFYISADKSSIFAFIRSLLPEKHRQRSNAFRVSILRAIFSQVRATIIMMLINFVILYVGLLLMGVDYAVLLALIIDIVDALPILGMGLFLIPMFGYGVFTGNALLAIGSAMIYLITIVMRQIVGPKIIGKQLGLHPLPTMMAMYAGLAAMGFLGMIIGPMMLLLCKVALTAQPVIEPEAAAPPEEAARGEEENQPLG